MRKQTFCSTKKYNKESKARHRTGEDTQYKTIKELYPKYIKNFYKSIKDRKPNLRNGQKT